MIAGMLMGLGASACWALANVAITRASRMIGFIRALVWSQVTGAVMAAPVSLALDEHHWALAPSLAGWIAVAGVAALLAYACMFYAFEHGKLTVSVPIMSSWAVIAAALSVLVFGERLRGAQLTGAAAVVAGALVVSRYGQGEGGRAADRAASRWLLASAGAAVGFGVVIPAIARLVPVFGSAGAVGVVYVADVALGLPIALALRLDLRPPHAAAWPAVLAAGLFETAGFVAIAAGSRLAPVALVSPLASLASAFTVLYAWTVLRERPARAVLAGAALVCAGAVALSL